MNDWLEENILSSIGWGVSIAGAILLVDMPFTEYFGILLLVAGSHMCIDGSK
jgi:hypothetical protein